MTISFMNGEEVKYNNEDYRAFITSSGCLHVDKYVMEECSRSKWDGTVRYEKNRKAYISYPIHTIRKIDWEVSNDD